jgi:hypothetical protein
MHLVITNKNEKDLAEKEVEETPYGSVSSLETNEATDHFD